MRRRTPLQCMISPPQTALTEREQGYMLCNGPSAGQATTALSLGNDGAALRLRHLQPLTHAGTGVGYGPRSGFGYDCCPSEYDW